ncbi:MAG: polysaccharide deacetylase family protein [Pseudomonadota bacterium]
MSPTEQGALCVAIHDVAPATWAECQHLLHAMQAVAEFPITWLVVPRYHGASERSPACEAMLERLLGQGHELALHGLTHCDDARAARLPWQHFLRTVYTQREGEFAAIGEADARRRIDTGLAWFRERGWPVRGFVAPAWLMSTAARQTLADYPFTYTTSYARFHLLGAEAGTVFSPALVYAARNGSGRRLSPLAVDTVARLLQARPLVRIALHPRDAHFPALVRHAQGLVERLLRTRQPCTKADAARRLAAESTSPSSRPATSESANSRHTRPDGHSSGNRRGR